MNSYTEGGQPAQILQGQALTVGGNLAAGWDTRGAINHLTVEGGQMTVQDSLAYRRFAGNWRGTANKAKRFEIGNRDFPNTVFPFGAGEETFNTSRGASSGDPSHSGFKFGYSSPLYRQGWYNLYYGFPDNPISQQNTVLAISGSNVPAEDAGSRVWLPKGFYAGTTLRPNEDSSSLSPRSPPLPKTESAT